MKPTLNTVLLLAAVATTGCSSATLRSQSAQQAPGNAARPILSDAEAQRFTPAHYFARGGLRTASTATPWQPERIDTPTEQADFVVGPLGAAGVTHSSVQQAVNAAIAKGNAARRYIRLLPGTYQEAVYIPQNAPALTIYGAGSKPADTRIELRLDAMMLPGDYARAVNPAAQFKAGDPAWHMFEACAKQAADKKIDTPCAAVFWAQSDALQLKNLSITNTLLDSVDAGTHQAVALRTDGDRTQLEALRLVGRQDTLLVNVGDVPTIANKIGTYPLDKITRAYIKDSYIEGDTDFVFGRANAVFDGCEFKVVSSRKADQAIVFAPDTLADHSYGFLVLNSRLTGDAGYQGSGRALLGRSWDQGASATGYLPGNTPNGQIVIRNSYIDSSYHRTQPWGAAATTNRPHRGNGDPQRQLDDVQFNRLWEYQNYGPGA